MAAMDLEIGLRPFLPARDLALSKRFYQALGWRVTYEDAKIAILRAGDYSFNLQDYYVREFAENCMQQLLVRDVDAWWARVDGPALVAEFGVKPPIAPALQSWGMRVGFIFDPAGVLWHIAHVTQ
jgi:catechol 2,3-dioxygenase-like lactoylglutathione lyase family enzyme